MELSTQDVERSTHDLRSLSLPDLLRSMWTLTRKGPGLLVSIVLLLFFTVVGYIAAAFWFFMAFPICIDIDNPNPDYCSDSPIFTVPSVVSLFCILIVWYCFALSYNCFVTSKHEDINASFSTTFRWNTKLGKTFKGFAPYLVIEIALMALVITWVVRINQAMSFYNTDRVAFLSWVLCALLSYFLLQMQFLGAQGLSFRDSVLGSIHVGLNAWKSQGLLLLIFFFLSYALVYFSLSLAVVIVIIVVASYIIVFSSAVISLKILKTQP